MRSRRCRRGRGRPGSRAPARWSAASSRGPPLSTSPTSPSLSLSHQLLCSPAASGQNGCQQGSDWSRGFSAGSDWLKGTTWAGIGRAAAQLGLRELAIAGRNCDSWVCRQNRLISKLGWKTSQLILNVYYQRFREVFFSGFTRQIEHNMRSNGQKSKDITVSVPKWKLQLNGQDKQALTLWICMFVWVMLPLHQRECCTSCIRGHFERLLSRTDWRQWPECTGFLCPSMNCGTIRQNQKSREKCPSNQLIRL